MMVWERRNLATMLSSESTLTKRTPRIWRNAARDEAARTEHLQHEAPYTVGGADRVDVRNGFACV
jgi:hypothetical protein